MSRLPRTSAVTKRSKPVLDVEVPLPPPKGHLRRHSYVTYPTVAYSEWLDIAHQIVDNLLPEEPYTGAFKVTLNCSLTKRQRDVANYIEAVLDMLGGTIVHKRQLTRLGKKLYRDDSQVEEVHAKVERLVQNNPYVRIVAEQIESRRDTAGKSRRKQASNN